MRYNGIASGWPVFLCGPPGHRKGDAVPYKDPEKRNEVSRRYKAANRERVNEAARERMRSKRTADPEAEREYQRRRRQEQPERYREYARRYYQKNREQALARNREWRQRTGHRNVKDRLRAQLVAELWQEQNGLCYLCDEPVGQDAAVLEHDHRCCPPTYFCSYCIRGVSHEGCNKAIGYVRDDPDRLEVMARNLRVKLAEVDVRLASKPQQGELA